MCRIRTICALTRPWGLPVALLAVLLFLLGGCVVVPVRDAMELHAIGKRADRAVAAVRELEGEVDALAARLDALEARTAPSPGTAGEAGSEGTETATSPEAPSMPMEPARGEELPTGYGVAVRYTAPDGDESMALFPVDRLESYRSFQAFEQEWKGDGSLYDGPAVLDLALVRRDPQATTRQLFRVSSSLPQTVTPTAWLHYVSLVEVFADAAGSGAETGPAGDMAMRLWTQPLSLPSPVLPRDSDDLGRYFAELLTTHNVLPGMIEQMVIDDRRGGDRQRVLVTIDPLSGGDGIDLEAWCRNCLPGDWCEPVCDLLGY